MKGKGLKDASKKARTEVVFDPHARKDYLTGFHKRKLARRRFGLAMQAIKDRKERLEERKERREALKEWREELGVTEDLDAFNIKARTREQSKAKADGAVHVNFEDRHTQEMFGDTVTVTTVEGIPDSDDEEAADDERLEQELLAEKKRVSEERWSLAAVQKRIAANMPAKTRKGANNRSLKEARSEKGKKGSHKRKAAAGIGAGAASASALMNKARSTMPRAELGKKTGKKRKRG